MFLRLIGAALALCLTATAHAQQPAAFKGGPYAGLTVGYSAAVLEADEIDLGAHGAFGGLYAGFGAYVGGVYLGVEGDGMLTDIKAGFSDDAFSVSGKSSYLASVRARAGLPIGPALAYVTAGPAFTDLKLGGSDGIDSVSKTETLIGLAVGGGLEAALTNTVLVRIEGLHYAFPDDKFSFGSEFGSVDLGQQETVIRLGIGIRLN